MSLHASGHTGSGQLIGHYPSRWGIHDRRARLTTMFLPLTAPRRRWHRPL
jgi:hypothetical protein